MSATPAGEAPFSGRIDDLERFERQSSQFAADATAFDYLCNLLGSLRGEIDEPMRPADAVPRQHRADVYELARVCRASRASQATFDQWVTLWCSYSRLARQSGGYFNAAGTVATSYESMEELWRDMEAQQKGESTGTVWDTYEHGVRRQLEQLCAWIYGADDALLVNSGMAAVLTALWSTGLTSGATVLTGERSYFETSRLLQQTLEPLQLNVLRTDLAASSVSTALAGAKPTAALFETVINLPDGPVLDVDMLWKDVSPSTTFIIDNSVQSALTPWFSIAPWLSDRLLVVESCIKYLTQDCMAGVVYGPRPLIDRCRRFARDSGLLLQGAAFNYLRKGELLHSPQRLSLHARNVAAFVDELRKAPLDGVMTAVSVGGRSRGGAECGLFERGLGAPVFVCLTAESSDGHAHREVLARWQRLLRNDRLNVPVRAGFGWPLTTARVYESEVLNQADAPVYLRISIGIEPESVIRHSARLLSIAARRTASASAS